jgi:hypothetical protein
VKHASMRGLTLTVLTMMVACSREPQLHPPAAPNTVTAETSSAVVNTSTASSSPAALTPDSVIAVAPVDTVGALRPGLLSSADSLCGDLVENGLAIPNSRRKAVGSQLGRPDSTRSQPTPNKHNPAQTDSTVDVFYPGLRLHYVVLGVAEGETDILYRADVSDNRYLKYPSLGIGASREAIVKALGEPEERTNDTYRYSCALHIMAGVTLYFHFDGDRVKFAEYWFDVD